ncbi:hypothetical protein Naga_100155g2 [Nannochloropsis gaditana]|nr:hypothetical protein Naga_100155g2 [Nannochloropsis gaditana]
MSAENESRKGSSEGKHTEEVSIEDGKRKKKRHRHESEEEERRLVKAAKKYLEKHGGGGHEERKTKADRKEEKHEKHHKKSHDKKAKKKKKEGRDEEKDAELEKSPPARAIPEVLSAEDDYYRRQAEFRVWLRLIRKLNFEDLPREEAQDQFARFVALWNQGRLPDMYYDGVPVHMQTEAHKTTHTWGFAAKMSEDEKDALDRMANSIVRSSTAPPGAGKAGGDGVKNRNGASAAASRMGGEGGNGVGSTRSQPQLSQRDSTRAGPSSAFEEAYAKPTGREAVLAARHAKGERLHGAARAKEEGRDGLDMPEEALGLGERDTEKEEVRRRQARQNTRVNQRQTEQERRMEEAARKEKDAMQKLMDTLGLQPGQKIVIPKRGPTG